MYGLVEGQVEYFDFDDAADEDAATVERAASELLALVDSRLLIQARLLLRNPLLELRPWIFDMNFGNFGGLFWAIFAHPAASRLQKSIPDGLTDLRARNESSGACLGPIFQSLSGTFKKCMTWRQTLSFLTFQPRQGLNFLSLIWPSSRQQPPS